MISGTKMDAKIDVGAYFFRGHFRMRFRIEFLSFSGGSEPLKSCSRAGGSMIFTNSTLSKKYRKNLDFGVVFGGQNHETSRKKGLENHVFF